jgi:phospholipid transport system substrate-binding protein
MVSTPAFAQTSAAHESATTAEGTFIGDLGQEAINILKNMDISKQDRTEKFRDLLRRTFDLETIARFVLGRNWMRATEKQQKEYLDLFEQLVVKTYSDRFTLYTGEGFRVTAVDAQGKKDKVVTSEITHPDGSQATSVIWRVRNRKGKMGIIDVVVEGISMSVTQRQEYSAIIQRNGGDIEALLKMMRSRADDKKEV